MKLIADIKTIGNTFIAKTNNPINLEDGEYALEIKKIRKARSLSQNAYFWALLGEICKLEDGDLRDEDTLYSNLLSMAGAKYETIYIKEEALKELKECEIIRHFRVVDRAVVKHQVFATVQIFYGSSQFDTKQMSDLIDTTLRYAEQVGVPNVANYWKGVLNR